MPIREPEERYDNRHEFGGRVRSTTILNVRHNGKVVIAGEVGVGLAREDAAQQHFLPLARMVRRVLKGAELPAHAAG